MKIRIASFDVGIRNFGQYIEEIETDEILTLAKEYDSLPKKYQRRVKGMMNDHIEDILEKMFIQGECIQCGVYDLTTDEDLTINTRRNLFGHLNNFKELFASVDIIVIEQQFFSTFSPAAFGKFKKKSGTEANVKAIKFAECVASWFLMNFIDKEIAFFNSTYKTNILGAPDGMTKPQRKKWSVEKFNEILQKRNDNNTQDILNKTKKMRNGAGKLQKLDDICDAALQCQAYKYKYLIAQFGENEN